MVGYVYYSQPIPHIIARVGIIYTITTILLILECQENTRPNSAQHKVVGYASIRGALEPPVGDNVGGTQRSGKNPHTVVKAF